MDTEPSLPKRFVDLKLCELVLNSGNKRTVLVADTYRSRLLGLAHLTTFPADLGLYFPKTTSIHTFGMRFSLDLFWLTEDHQVFRVDRNVAPYHFRHCRFAYGVVEFVSQSYDENLTT